MARKPQTKLGDDPLEWMQEGDDAAKPKAAAPAKERRTKSRRKLDTSAAEEPGLAVQLLEDSFALLAPQGEELVERFYGELFERFPAVIPMFEGTDRKEQERKLLAALKLVVNSLRKPEALSKALAELGERHQGYGALPDHYGAVASTLLDVMAEMAGDAWNDELSKAWQGAISQVGEMMLNAYGTMEAGAMATSKKAVQEQLGGHETAQELIRLRSAVDGAMTAIMMINRDFEITYANQATTKLLRDNVDELRKAYPGFDPNKLMGQNIDQFHSQSGAPTSAAVGSKESAVPDRHQRRTLEIQPQRDRHDR